jgi:hypothetical protein
MPERERAWWHEELTAIQTGRVRDAEVAALLEEGLERLDAALALLEQREHLQPTDFHAAHVLLHVANSIRAATRLAYGGRDVQALSLARVVQEEVVAVFYLAFHPEEWESWMKGRRRDYDEMFRDVESKLPPVGPMAPMLTGLRQFLNRFAHQDTIALAFTYERAHAHGLRPDPHPDTTAVHRCAFFIIPLTAMAMWGLSMLLEPLAPAAEWIASAQEFSQRAYAWCDRLNAREPDLLTGLRAAGSLVSRPVSPGDT